jgi:hypothetical protein
MQVRGREQKLLRSRHARLDHQLPSSSSQILATRELCQIRQVEQLERPQEPRAGRVRRARLRMEC